PRRHRRSASRDSSSHPHHFHDDSLPALAVELRVEHLLPWTQIQFSCRDRQRHLMAHDRALQMRVRVVLACLMMLVIEPRRRELLEPDLKIVDETALPVVDVYAGGDVHRRHEYR